MKNFMPLFFIVCIICVSGCATTKDLQRVHGELDRKISDLKEDNVAIRKDIEKMNEAVLMLRKSQAEMSADITDIRDNLQKLRGTDEQLRKEVSSLKEKLDSAVLKVNFMENFLGIGKKHNHADGERPGKMAAKTPIKGKMNKESFYAAAYELFKEGQYEKARDEFQNFLKQYPDTEYSDNAQFWIGECYYFEKQYEKAILEYEKVVKNYPGGSKVPYALLKQGLSFLNLGDKSSASLILQRVIKDFPNTNQARIARAKLSEIK